MMQCLLGEALAEFLSWHTCFPSLQCSHLRIPAKMLGHISGPRLKLQLLLRSSSSGQASAALVSFPFRVRAG